MSNFDFSNFDFSNFKLNNYNYNCFLFAVFGVGLLFATKATMCVSHSEHEKIKAVLSPEIDKVYDDIVRERSDIYFSGILIGLVLSFLTVNYLLKPINTFHTVMIFFTITISVSIVYYFFMPKSNYMLKYLNTPSEKEAWLDTYKTMKYRFIIGFILGSLTSIPFALSFCKNE